MRLFVALPLSNDLQAALTDWMERCGARSGLRWTPTEQLHITLQFLSEVAEERLAFLIEALSGISVSGFDVRIERLEVLGRGDILAAAVEPDTPLVALAQAVRESLIPFVPHAQDANRGFRPHVTLARARRGEPAPMPRLLPRLPALSFRAACFRLYQSELRPEGAVHTVVREWPLVSTPMGS